jgi:hypothetical protein
MAMELKKLLSKLFRRKRKGSRRSQDAVRAETISRIRARGFELVDVSGQYNGKIAVRRYVLTDPKGHTLDNNGEGYACSSDALKAIIDRPRIVKKSKSLEP